MNRKSKGRRQKERLVFVQRGIPFFLLSTFCLLPFRLSAQGILPPKTTAQAETAPPAPYLLIGERVPDRLTVTDANGKVLPLLSYKSALELLVVGFYSPRCSDNQALWRDLLRFYEAYKEWNVAFVGISSDTEENLSELSQAMSKAGLTYPALRDENHQVAKTLHAMAAPEIMIIDEWGHLRYRGPLRSSDASRTPYAREAIEAVIGHVNSVPNAEPGDLTGCPIQ